MEELPKNLTPPNINNFKNQWIEHILCFLRLEVTEFLLQNINKEFFDFAGFFTKFKISNNSIQTKLMNQIIEELKSQGWYIASIFGNTAIVIHTSEEDLKKSLWSGSFDFVQK